MVSGPLLFLFTSQVLLQKKKSSVSEDFSSFFHGADKGSRTLLFSLGS